ncbi:MAG: glutamate racemase [Bacteroidales bacterium]|jgi:glutamate racemase|nr:glutamate racemase [Bacteroidales bacterium]
MIGIFDSGAGGLSVWKELIKVLPSESYFYISDSEYCPYGPKSKKTIVERTSRIASFLIERGAEIIVVACNTATAGAITELRQQFDIPFVGMEPAVKPAAIETKTGVIGVLATKGTFNGRLYINTSEKFARKKDIKIVERVGDGLVELVEQGKTKTLEAEQLVKKYIDPMIQAGADYVVLGCTHYPFLEEAINKVSANKINVINPAPAVAKHAKILFQKEREKRAEQEGICRDTKKEQNTIATTGSNIDILKGMALKIVDDAFASGELTAGEREKFQKANFIHLDI